MKDRPTGIIRTLTHSKNNPEQYQRFMDSIDKLSDDGNAVLIALSNRPQIEVLHLYLVIEGKVHLRMNLVEFIEGGSLKCWDGKTRAPKYWAVCAGPVSYPPKPIARRGFQGFRYTSDLW